MLYQLFKNLFLILFKIFNRLEVSGTDNLPQTGPVIIASNHVSNWDPLVLGGAMPRQVYFIAKEELFKAPIIGFLMKSWGAVSVKRGRGDRETISKALEILKEEKTIGIFIEGKRNKGNPEEMLKPQPGAAMLAAKSHAPIVPVVLLNTRKCLIPFYKVRVIVGKPIYFKDNPSQERKEHYGEIGNIVVTEILKLRNN